MNEVIMWVMAVGAVLGGLDRIAGNRFGLGRRFEEGFEFLGATALSMAGIICLVPLLSEFLMRTAVPLCGRIGLNPAMLGGVLAIDMGGYQLAAQLTEDLGMAGYAGILVAATFGCTVTFTVPVGMGMVKEEDRPSFAKGILAGLAVLPAALLLGGCMCGLSPAAVLVQSLPIFLLSAGMAVGIWKRPDQTVRGFLIFSGGIRVIATAGLVLGAVAYMTGRTLPIPMTPLTQAMQTVSAIGIVMLGSLPAAELLQRLCRRPMAWIGAKTGMNQASLTGLLMGGVSAVPAIALIREMDERGKIVNGAFLVCAASALAAHLGFAFGTVRQMVLPLLAVKFAGGILGAITAIAFTKKMGGNRR